MDRLDSIRYKIQDNLIPQSRRFDRKTLGLLLVLPLLIVLVGLMGFPMLSAAYVSLQDKWSGSPGEFVGLANYVEIFTEDKVIPELFFNTVLYAVASVAFKLILGLVMALVLNEAIPARNFFRGWLLLPWITPMLVTALTWRWMFNQTGGIINYILLELGLVQMPPAWLASKGLARFALIVANVWRGFPFFGITLLAGLQSIPQEQYEAAEMDGASVWQRIRHVTLPGLEPVLLIVIVLSIIWTFNDFALVWVMTQGGPSYSTHLFVTYSFHTAFRGTRIGYAAAISIVSTPLVLLLIAALAPRLWGKEEEE